MTASIRVLLLLTATLLGPAAAADDVAGEFDYWVLALSWSPQHCSQHLEDAQCRRPFDFVLHGLWPQHEEGYPDFCGGSRQVDHSLVERMLPLMPGEGQVHHQWRKHGSCSGMPADEYFLNVERGWRAVSVPETYRNPEKLFKTSVAEIEAGFIAVNPHLTGDAMAVRCSGRFLKEALFCLDKDFKFRACGEDVADRCKAEVTVRPNRDSVRRHQ